jgi:ankyrin repeat protein
VRRILEELPESLDGTYERVLKEIRKPNQLHTHRLIQCLVVAARPLRVEELAEVLAIDFDSEVTARLNPDLRWPDQERAVMSACSSLISIVNDGDSRVVQFSHFSVKEFLMSRRLSESSQDISRYHIELEAAHTILARACLGVLLRLDDYVDHDSLENYPLARYAAQYWFKHAQFENVSSHVKDGMNCLFDADRPYFATWLSIHNCDSPRRTRTMQPSKPNGVPLYYAARLGFRDLVERLLAKHPEDIKARGGSCVTPLHAAVARGHIDVVSLLIEYFPDLEIRGRWDQTPLHRASWDGHLEVAQLLLSRGADVSARDDIGWTPLYAAVVGGHLDVARMLLEHKAEISIPKNNGETPLHAASQRGYVELARFLLEHGADPNARDEEDRTPSEIATLYDQEEIVQLLSEYGAKSTLT